MTTQSIGEMVKEFHKAFNLTVNEELTTIDYDELQLAYDLIEEEFEELWESCFIAGINEDTGYTDIRQQKPYLDHVEVADALADIVYTCFGMATRLGIDLDSVVKEVHRSNMTKLDNKGKPVYNESGKVIKSENFEPPSIAEVLAKWQ